MLLFVAMLMWLSPPMFEFAIDQDALQGAPDFSWLNQPLEAKDRLFVRDGHFFRVGADLTAHTEDDERVRMFGVNLAFGANFPSEADATRIAKRLRKLGVNLVRFHHMDSQPDSNEQNAGSILTTGPYPTFNPVAVERLRRFLDALRAEGIYANLNLKVGYRFRPSVDEVPALPNNLAMPDQSKPLHMIYPRMVGLQSEFARNLLRLLAVKDDPVLGMVELNNESSLLYAWQVGQLDTYLLGEYETSAIRQWAEFLKGRYDSTETLRATWGGSTPEGAEVLPGRWASLEVHSPAQARLEMVDGAAKVTVTTPGNWVILKQTGFSLAAGTAYSAEVEIRADLAAGQTRNVDWRIQAEVSALGWPVLAGRTIAVTNQWQKVRWGMTSSLNVENAGRFGFWLENVGAPVYVRGASFRPAGLRGLDETETLENGNIALVSAVSPGTPERTNDFVRFLAERDRAYSHSLLAAIREQTDGLVPVTGTQQEFAGLMVMDSQFGLDYFDKHWYVDHYSFPNTSWDGRDWRIRDTSNVASGLDVFLQAAAARPHGFPYTVSEFNQPWPNRQAAEMNPTFSAFAAFQDWDALMHFAYSHGRGWDDGVPNGFNINGDWTKYPNIGQSAWLFRTGAVKAGVEPIDLPAPEGDRIRHARERRTGNFTSFFRTTAGFEPMQAVLHPIRVRPELEGRVPEAAQQAVVFPARSDTGEMTYDRDGRYFLIHSEQAAGVIGWVGSTRLTAGLLDVELNAGARGFVSVLLTSLDGKGLTESGRMLLSNAGYTLRSQPGTEPAVPQELVPYGSGYWTLQPDLATKRAGNLNSGQKPTWMEQVDAVVAIRSLLPELRVYPLTGSGERMEPLPVEASSEGHRVRLNAATPWYEIVGDERAPVPK